MTRTPRVSRRLPTILLGVVFGFTTFAVSAAPSDVPLPRPEALQPKVAHAAFCADEPAFTGHLTASSGSTAAVSRITNPNVFGYLSNVDDDWSCTAYFRYSGLTWNTSSTLGTFNWGNLINSTGVACNWAIGSTDYLKANSTTDCPDTDAEYAMQVTLSPEGEYVNNANHSTFGQFSWVHTDCGTYYGAEPIKTGQSFSGSDTGNRPGSNCDPIVLDGQTTNQTVTYDATAPATAFDLPAAGGPVAVPAAFYVVQFDATDAVAGFLGANDWELRRQVATWNGTVCDTFANDTGAQSLVTGTTSAANQLSGQSLALGKCYRWTLAASDANGNAATTKTSGSIRTDTAAVLGLQPQFGDESWDLGSGDTVTVNPGSGNAVIQHPILTLPIRGSSVALGLTYNSHDATNVGVGPGWRLDVQRRLTINGDNTVTFAATDGSRHTFTNPQTVGTVTTYTRPATLYGTLVKDTAVPANEFVLTYRDLAKDKFDILGSEGLLVREEDRFGNGVTIAYTGGTSNIATITDTAGSRTIDFSWDTAPTPDRLTSITDWAWISGGIVQTGATGARRQYRLFYDGSGNLAGWSDPLNTSGSCPTGGSHLTCLTTTSGLVTSIKKTQTVEIISGTALSTSTRVIDSQIGYTFADATAVKDAEQVNAGTAGTTFSHPAPGQTKVVRLGTPNSETTYGPVSVTDALGRVQSVWRKLGGSLIEQRTTYDASYPIEPASVTDNYGALGGTPARTVSYAYVASSLGLVAKVTEPLTATDDRWTEYTYNANNDVTKKLVSLEGSATDKTETRFCYDASCTLSGAGLTLLKQIDNYTDGTAGNGLANEQDVSTSYQYDAFGQRTRVTRANYKADGTLLDARADGMSYDALGNLTGEVTNYVDGTVTGGTADTVPDATGARTDLTTSHTYDTAGNRVSVADPRRAIALATAGTTYVADTFSRTVSDAWGAADTGGTWSNPDPALDVNGAAGTITLGSATGRSTFLTGVAAGDTDLLAKIRVDQLAVGDQTYARFYLRRQDNDNWYQVRIAFRTDQSIRLTLRRSSAGTDVGIGSEIVGGEAHTTSASYWVRARLSGTSSVNAKIRLWRDGTTEPGGWALDVTDGSPPANLQGTGHVGVRFQVDGTGTFPVTATFDDLAITTISGAPAYGPDDYVSRMTYDPLNQEVTETTPTTPGVAISQKTATSAYDELGAVREATDFGGVKTGTNFDRAGRALETYEDTPTANAAKTSVSTFDAAGRTLTTKDRKQVADASLGYSQFVYDELGRTLAEAFAVGTATAAENDSSYDFLDRTLTATVGVGTGAAQTTTYGYDLGGRVLSLDDEFTCATATFDYRDLATVENEGLTPGSPCTGTALRTVSHTNDGLGRRTRSEVTAGTGVGDRPHDVVLDGVDRALTAAITTGGATKATTTSTNILDQAYSVLNPDASTTKTSFDPAGNATDVCYWAPGATVGDCHEVGHSPWSNPPTKSTTTTYDARNNRIGLTDSATNGTTVYDPDHNYQVAAIYLPTVAGSGREHQTLNTYDDRHRLTGVTFQLCVVSTGHACSSTTATGSDTFAYDDNDNRTQVVEHNGAASTDRRYCYDALDQLEFRNTGAACGPSAKDEKYVYDDAGNRTRTEIGAVNTDFAYTAAGQLCKTGGTTCTGANVTYDAAGRTKTWNGWTFSHDADGRILSACKSATCAAGFDKVEFTYDAQGHRTQLKTTSAAGAVSTTDFRYQDDAIVEERLTDAAHPSGAVVRTYLTDDTGSIVRMTIPVGETGAGSYLVTWSGHGDALGLWRIESDGSLTLANSFSYTTWGAPTTATHNGIPDLGFRFLYVGEFDVQWDDPFGLGLHYMHARHYSPALGRFLQPDPDRSEANLYAYAANSPVTEIDPDGTCFVVCLVIGAVIDSAVYLATTKNANLGGLAKAVVGGAVESAINPFAKIGKVVRAVSTAHKILTRVPRAARTFHRSAQRAWTRYRSPRENTVYISKRGGVPEYVGITRNFAQRSAAHRRVGRTVAPVSRRLTNLSRFDAHSVEQALIRRHGLGSRGGTLTNKINSVSRRDPLSSLYTARGRYLLWRSGL
jgi:RHS repeat-associated protein